MKPKVLGPEMLEKRPVESTKFTYIKLVEGKYVEKEVYDVPTHTIERGDDGKTYDIRQAVDFICGRGIPVKASRGGKVVKIVDGRTKLWDKGVETLPEDYFETDDEQNGNYIVIEHEPNYGERSIYCHLEPGTIHLERGQEVGTEDIIAKTGHNGLSMRPHLHFVVGYWKNPNEFISRKIRWE